MRSTWNNWLRSALAVVFTLGACALTAAPAKAISIDLTASHVELAWDGSSQTEFDIKSTTETGFGLSINGGDPVAYEANRLVVNEGTFGLWFGEMLRLEGKAISSSTLFGAGFDADGSIIPFDPANPAGSFGAMFGNYELINADAASLLAFGPIGSIIGIDLTAAFEATQSGYYYFKGDLDIRKPPLTVPEPASLSLLALGGLAFARARRSRRGR